MSLTYANNARMAEYNTLKGDHIALVEKHKKLSINTQGLVDKVKAAEQAKKIAENRTTKAQAALKAAEFTISADTDELRDRMVKEHESFMTMHQDKTQELYATIKNNTKLFEILQVKYDNTKADWAIANNLSKKLQQELQEANVQAGEFEAKLQSETAKREKLEKEAKRIIPESLQITTLENKYNKLYNKLVSAKNKITSLNASTPYRPGAVERTLAGVMEDLKNV